MKPIIRAKVKDVILNKDSGELYVEIRPEEYATSFYVFFEGEGRYKIKKGDTINLRLYSLMPLNKSKSEIEKIIVEKNQNHLVDYIGKIAGIDKSNFLVDATLPILVDKEPGYKIGDYVTGGFNHTIQARLVNKEGNYE